MLLFKRIKVRSHEMGLHFREGEFQGLLGAGRRRFFDPLWKVRVKVVSLRDPWLTHDQLDMIVKSGALEGHAETLDLKDHQRALVWIDGRFDRVLGPGLYAYWTALRKVVVEIVDARTPRFEHRDLSVIVDSKLADRMLESCTVQRSHQGVLFRDGQYVETLPPGRYAFWWNGVDAKVVEVDMREAILDLSGQEIMTADKLTLRLNAVLTYRVADAHKVVTTVDGARETLYREAQLALRAVVGGRDLDAFLADKDSIAEEMVRTVRPRAAELGIEVVSAGVRDIILPGEIKDLMNKVTEAKKAAEANLIARREETAAMRSQANTAKLLESNATLMRLRELEVLEKVAASSNLKLVLGEKGLADRITNLV